jgi:hypothetical protein
MRVVRESMAEGIELVIGREMHGGIASHKERPTVTNSGTLVLRVGAWAAAFLHAWWTHSEALNGRTDQTVRSSLREAEPSTAVGGYAKRMAAGW